jgi:acylphosphatase
VGFRWYVLREAERLGIGGWVRNLADGRVEAAAAGSEEALREFEAVLRRGPRLAHVENVEKVDIPHDAIADKSFHIK